MSKSKELKKCIHKISIHQKTKAINNPHKKDFAIYYGKYFKDYMTDEVVKHFSKEFTVRVIVTVHNTEGYEWKENRGVLLSL